MDQPLNRQGTNIHEPPKNNQQPTQENGVTSQNNQQIYDTPAKQSQNQAIRKPQYEAGSLKHQQSEEQSWKFYLIALALFLAAFCLFVLVWAVQKFAANHEVSSHYYEKSYNWAGIPSGLQVTVSSTAPGIAIKLISEWIIWKGPLILFTYNCIRLNQATSKWITLGVHTGLLLAIDLLLTIFVLDIYNNMMYFGVFTLFNLGMAVFNNLSLNRTKQAVFDSFFPLLWIGLSAAVMLLLLPILYKVYFDNMAAAAMNFLAVYAFPLFDLLMFGLLLFLGTFLSEEVRIFHSMLHFLLIGFEVGFTLLCGYTEVEFFYLITYFILRNVFCNYVMFKWEKRLNLPTALPLWVLAYYFSYILNFLPYSGIGNLRTSTGFYSVLLINTSTVLYGVPSSLYPNNPYTAPSSFSDDLNTSLNGNIYFIGAIIVWVGLTFSNRYSKKMPEIVFNIVYYTFGIYLFYLGLGSGIATVPLFSNSIVS